MLLGVHYFIQEYFLELSYVGDNRSGYVVAGCSDQLIIKHLLLVRHTYIYVGFIINLLGT